MVDPQLMYPMDSIVCQTVLSKLLGPLPTWKDKLEVAYRSGYNMIHFTPIQVKAAHILSQLPSNQDIPAGLGSL